MAADSMCPGAAEHPDEMKVHKASDASSGSADADAPAQESTAASMRPDDEEDEVFKDEATAENEPEEPPGEQEEEEEEEEEEKEEDEDEEKEDDDDDEEEEEEPHEQVKAENSEATPSQELEAGDAGGGAEAEVQEEWEEEELEEELQEELQEDVQEELTEEKQQDELQEEDEMQEQDEGGRNAAEEHDDEELELEDEEEEEEEEPQDLQEEDDEEEAEEEEDALEDEEDEQKAETAEPAQPHQELARRGKPAKEDFPDLPHQSDVGSGRQWGRRAVSSEAAQGHPKASSSSAGAEMKPQRSVAHAQGGESSDGGRPARIATSPTTKGSVAGSDQKTYAQLEAENSQLRLELGQATYKVQRMAKLQQDAADSKRAELLARQSEAKALKEMDIAKEYVGKKDSFARCEKAELLLQIKRLEDAAGQIDSQEQELAEELAEAGQYRRDAEHSVQEAQQATERWRADAQEQTKEVKQLQHRLKQMEEKRQQDKARLRELAQLCKLHQKGALPAAANDEIMSSSTSPEKGAQKSTSAKNSRGSSQIRKCGDSANHDGACFEDPIKPVKGSGGAMHAEEESAGIQGQLVALWQCTLRPLLSRGNGVLELEGDCSGAPSRGKGKKGPRSGAGTSVLACSADDAAEQVRRQRMVVLVLVVVIVGLAVGKLAIA